MSGAWEALADPTRRTIVERLARERDDGGRDRGLFDARAPRRLAAPAGAARGRGSSRPRRSAQRRVYRLAPARPRRGRAVVPRRSARSGGSVSTLSRPRSPAACGPDDRSRDERADAGAGPDRAGRRARWRSSSTGTTRRRPTTSGRRAPSPTAWRAGSPPCTGDLRPGWRLHHPLRRRRHPACRVVTCEAPSRLVWEWPIGDVAEPSSPSRCVADGDGLAPRPAARAAHRRARPRGMPRAGTPTSARSTPHVDGTPRARLGRHVERPARAVRRRR